jgi:hypothetical protein
MATTAYSNAVIPTWLQDALRPAAAAADALLPNTLTADGQHVDFAAFCGVLLVSCLFFAAIYLTIVYVRACVRGCRRHR